MKKITEYLFRVGKQRTPIEAASSAADNISTCGVHDENKYPHVKALEQAGEIGMCYICANEHADDFHTIDWGFDIFNRMEAPRSELNDQFNQGYRTTVDLE